MKRKKFILLLVCGAVGIFIGAFIGVRTFKKNKNVAEFTAIVLEHIDNTLLVSRTSIEPYGYAYGTKDSISFSRYNEEFVLDENGNRISMSEIPIGSSVRIEYDGRVLEMSPGIILGTYKIEIIERPPEE